MSVLCPPTRSAPHPRGDWSWVLAAPFRVHVEGLLHRHALPWRALAGYAEVPDRVVRALLGLDGRRRVRRIAPHYAHALMSVDDRRLHEDLGAAVPGPWIASSAQLLRDAGWQCSQIAETAGAPQRVIEALLSGRPVLATRRTELLLLAALRAHGLDADDGLDIDRVVSDPVVEGARWR